MARLALTMEPTKTLAVLDPDRAVAQCPTQVEGTSDLAEGTITINAGEFTLPTARRR